jgi:hypothetical protein
MYTYKIKVFIMREKAMATNVRLNDMEQEAIRKKSIEINKLLIGNNKEPLKDSELVHKILELSISYVKLNNKGELYLEI